MQLDRTDATGDSDCAVNGGFFGNTVASEYISRHHGDEINDNQCTSVLKTHIKAPIDHVWSLARRFDQPQKYKPFVSNCTIDGEPRVGSIREVNIKSGLPATTSKERLEFLDDENHILHISIIGGDHRLRNYSSIVTARSEMVDGREGTLVVESFVVDVPEGNTLDDTRYFVEAYMRCNHRALAEISEGMARQSPRKDLS